MTTPAPRPRSIRVEKDAATPARLTRVIDAETGAPIRGVTAVNINLDVKLGSRMVVTVVQPELVVDVDASRVRWVGLEKVDTEALRAELARRGG